ncbi:adenylate/guanylate cyclase domain-containing protein [Cetobacterium sp.]|uniref:adenylate/guanylate cyclase domain-containing protein n=1 Tax=Cetobacterium sp. TaxID=2071632 RepID=UPI003F3D0421
MATYDYKAGKKRVEEILNNKLEVKEQEKIPKDENFTYSNGYYGWVSSIFVDIRDSTTIFSKSDKEEVSKMIRAFTSEIIEILRGDDNEREIGIRGDCVYCIYTTPLILDIVEIMDKASWINTYMNMLNKLLKNKGFDQIKAGIGVATNKELVVKAGRKDTGINNKVWIGDAVSKASKLSGLGDTYNTRRICITPTVYNNIIETYTKNNKDANSWFTKKYHDKYGYYYECSLI